MTDVLIAARLVARGERDGEKSPGLRRVGVASADGANAMEQYADELRSVRASLSE